MAEPESTAASAADAPSPDWHDLRRRKASRLVYRYSVYAVGAGLVPLPFFDLAALTGLHLSMMARLSEMYGVRYTQEIGKTFVVPVITAGLPFTRIYFVAASAVKLIPLVGTFSGLITLPTLCAAVIFALGKVMIRHYE